MTAVLQVEDLTMRFGAVTAADNVSVTLRAGEFVAIVGPNGAGKTTFLNLVTGYIRPLTGRVHFLDHNILGLTPRQITELGVGRSFQWPQLFTSQTVLENVLVALAAGKGEVAFWQPLKTRARLEAAAAVLEQFGLGDMAHRPASELPEGGRKLLDVAMAFALRPRLMLMDEPTSGVSVEDKFQVIDTLVQVLRANGITTMFVEHDMEVVRRFANRVLVLSQGKIAADGDPEAVLGDPQIRAMVAGWG